MRSSDPSYGSVHVLSPDISSNDNEYHGFPQLHNPPLFALMSTATLEPLPMYHLNILYRQHYVIYRYLVKDVIYMCHQIAF